MPDMGDVRRNELIYRGPIEAGGATVQGELRSNGTVWAIFPPDGGGQVIEHFIDPTVSFSDGFMVVTGHPPGEAEGVTRTWRIQQPEVVKLSLEKQVVKSASGSVTGRVIETQYRVQVINKAKNIDISYPGAKIKVVGGKRVIDNGGEIFTLGSEGCGCGSRR